MDPLEVSASAIAVVELAAMVVSLFLEYSSAVKNARPDIERLQQHVDNLRTVLEGTQQLLQTPDGTRLKHSQKLRGVLDSTHSQLETIQKTLEARLGTKTGRVMRRLGLRALKWPFESKDMEEILVSLRRDQETVSACLCIDQTYVGSLQLPLAND